MIDEVPFFSLQRENEYLKSDLVKAFEIILDHSRVLQSSEVVDLENLVANETGRSFAISNGSCTDSLYFSLVALGVGIGDEVIVPGFSFIASASCILRLGAIPVFVDVNDFGNLNSEGLERAINTNTKAIIYVHMYGLVEESNLLKVITIGREHKIPVIEDAAQSFGSKGDISGTRAGEFGVVSCVSFDPTKVLSALGSGGMVLTDDAKLAKRVRELRYHGKGVDGSFDSLGFNSQMSTINASALAIKLAYNDQWLSKRRQIAKAYIDNLDDLPLVLPFVTNTVTHNYHKFVIKLKPRDDLLSYLKQSGIQAMIHYKEPIPAHKTFRQFKKQLGRCKNATKLSKTCLSLPCHAFLNEAEIRHVIDTIRTFFDTRKP